jgi:uncharacterized protein
MPPTCMTLGGAPVSSEHQPALEGRIAALHVYPIKSCAGIAVDERVLSPTGLDLDRDWMVVDADGGMLTQREWPRLALVQPSFKHGDVVLRAPGMLALHLRADTVEGPTHAQVWGDRVRAFEMGALAGQWFSDFLGRPGTRLVRFDPDERRRPDAQWTAGLDVEVAFADGFPLLVIGSASLAELNRRLVEAGTPAITMQRLRPNIVLDGLEAFDEDHLGVLDIDTPEGPARLRLTKPCVRCTIPDVDPATATTGHAVGDMLARFRANARFGGGITFGMNAVIEGGFNRSLRTGMAVRARYAF